MSVLVEEDELTAVLVRRRVEVACRIPAALLAGRERIRVTLRHPDATRPCDHEPSEDRRILGMGVESLQLETLPVEQSGPDDATVLQSFVSLGDNCEFGFVQERCGLFAGGLLRFNSLPTDRLLHGLATRFEGFPDRARMRLERHDTLDGGKEYIVYEDGYEFGGHTTVSEQLSPAEEEALLDREHARLGFLTRMLLDELEGNETIFVFKRNAVPAEAEIMALWLAIRRLGRGTLLWVVPEEPGLPSGSVTMLAEGLFRAHVNRLAPYTDAEDLSLPCWLTICRRVLRLSRLDQAARP